MTSARSTACGASKWHYASLVFLAPLYQLVLTSASAVAVYKYASGDKTWYKTGAPPCTRGAPPSTPPRYPPRR
jgi:hypothetical protein